ncbi:Short chain dehydrogenase reductase [Mycena sanguinolenta]|uniref:Short chain dehydrogenase reductase n=1 Tax=Mycena sanguinolenta TaxID=230812 RepID=A0A8H7D9T9_9AGAR|nr:Short chain dehydrogenase reductase [Mycena sanguinolenta]
MSKQRTVLVTGSSQGGIGAALAKEYHSRGLRVFATSRRLETMEELAALGIETIALDVTDADAVRKTRDEISSRTGGKLDILVNNAGQIYEAAVADTDMSRARALFEVNVFAPMVMVQEFIPLLISSGKGCVVNIGSSAGLLPLPLQAAYNMSKAAIHSFGYTLAVELAPFNVNVVNVSVIPVLEAEQLPRHIQLQKDAPTAESYARMVVSETIKSKPKMWLWGGHLAGLTWFLLTFVPRFVIESIVIDMFGFKKFTARVRKERASGKYVS